MANVISSYAATVLSIICKKMPKLLDYIVKQSSNPKEYNKILSLPFTLLTSDQVQVALDSDEGLLNEALALIAEIQKSLNNIQEKLNEIEDQKFQVQQTTGQMMNLIATPQTVPTDDSEAYTEEFRESGETGETGE